MHGLVFFLWLALLLLDTGGQMAFKAAARDERAGNGLARWRYMFARPWIWAGVSCYVGQFVVSIAFLSLVPLSKGVLLESISIVTIMVAGRLLFAERLSPLRLAGILLVAAGVAIVGASA
jgi:drug/metabolite transporter (DMT)-like permease